MHTITHPTVTVAIKNNRVWVYFAGGLPRGKASFVGSLSADDLIFTSPLQVYGAIHHAQSARVCQFRCDVYERALVFTVPTREYIANFGITLTAMERLVIKMEPTLSQHPDAPDVPLVRAGDFIARIASYVVIGRRCYMAERARIVPADANQYAAIMVALRKIAIKELIIGCTCCVGDEWSEPNLEYLRWFVGSMATLTDVYLCKNSTNTIAPLTNFINLRTLTISGCANLDEKDFYNHAQYLPLRIFI